MGIARSWERCTSPHPQANPRGSAHGKLPGRVGPSVSRGALAGLHVDRIRRPAGLRRGLPRRAREVASLGEWRRSPQWSKDGKDLYYMDPTYNLLDVPVKEVGGALQFGTAQQLVSNWSAPQVFYDVSPDGKKILLDRISQQVSQSVTVVTNFTAGLKK